MDRNNVGSLKKDTPTAARTVKIVIWCCSLRRYQTAIRSYALKFTNQKSQQNNWMTTSRYWTSTRTLSKPCVTLESAGRTMNRKVQYTLQVTCSLLVIIPWISPPAPKIETWNTRAAWVYQSPRSRKRIGPPSRDSRRTGNAIFVVCRWHIYKKAFNGEGFTTKSACCFVFSSVASLYYSLHSIPDNGKI